MKLVSLAVFAAIAPSLCFAEVLWGKADAGASLLEIQKAYPEGESVKPTPNQKLNSGAVLGYRTFPVPIVGENFNAEFYFLAGKLEQVTLRLKSSKTEAECRHTTISLIEALRSKYGNPVKDDGTSVSPDTAWTSGKTTISLFGTNLPATNTCTLYVFYNQRIATSASNL